MSLRDFKQSLKACSSFPSASPSTRHPSHPHPAAAAAGDAIARSRKPPKGSLSKQIALLERLAAGLDCTPSGETLPPSQRCDAGCDRREDRLLDGAGSELAARVYGAKSQLLDGHGLGLAAAGIARVSDGKNQLLGGDGLRLEARENAQASDGKNQLLDGDGLEVAAMEDALISGTMDKGNASYELLGGREGPSCQKRKGLSWTCLEDCLGDAVASAEMAGSEGGVLIHSQRGSLFEPLVLWPPNADDADATHVVQVPASINCRLLEHQREGVQFLYNLYRENRGGVLGDDMGLGKTIQTIGFVAAILGKTDFDHPINDGMKHSPVNPVLIICPTSVLKNWELEFLAWGTFKVAIYHGIQREVVTSKLESKEVEVILTSFDTFRIHGEYLWEINWECVVIDEAHRLKNEKSQLYKICTKIRTKRRYGLTGTIMQNKLMDLFNVFDMVAPHCLGTREHFRDFYDEALKHGQRTSASERLVRIAEERKLHLSKVLQKHLLRRTKEGTIGHTMMGKEDNVVFCTMSSLQQRVYRRLLESPDFQCLIKKDFPCSCGSPLTQSECCYRTVSNGVIWSYLHRENPDGCDSCPFCLVLPCLMKLQQVSNHLELIKPNAKDEFDKQKKDEALATAVLGEDASLIGGVAADESFLGLSDSRHCGKIRALELLLAHWTNQGDKILLFSYSVRMLDILEKFLIRKGYCFSRLDGSTPLTSRQSIVDDFNNSPSKQVFLISTRAGGLGLNLVSANRVVIFDPNWNPAQDLQAQDRSFRYGQRRHVTVFRLLAAGSLEELIYTRQVYKQQLFNIAVSGNQEKRYFEGVQDSKQYKGELFGISNLFRDICDRVFTSEIIESHGQRFLSSAEAENIKLDRVDQLSHILSDAGVIYAHRNEDIVNLRAAVKDSVDYTDSKQQIGSCLVKKGRSKVHEKDWPAISQPVTSRGKREHLKKLKKVTRENATSEARAAGKENQFAQLAQFKCMDVTEFSKWLLAVSESEREQLLRDFESKVQHGKLALREFRQ